MTHGLGVRGEDATDELEDQVGVRADLRVRKGDPLVNKGSILQRGAEKGGVGGTGSN